MSDERRTPRAATYFEIRLRREHVSRLRMGGRRVGVLFLWLADPTGWAGFEPKLSTTVEVVRLSDQAIVVDYQHHLESDALDHARSLQARLATMSIADFARELGIGSSLF